jgi:hypothetical protein
LVAELRERTVILRIHLERLYIALRYLWNSICASGETTGPGR